MKIRVVDIETTGDHPPEHGVCELGWCDVRSTEIQEGFLEGVKRLGGWVVSQRPESLLVKPPCPIPPETAAVHHILDEDVADAPAFHQVAPFVFATDELGETAALAAHSAKFERRFISDEVTGGLPWVDTYKCALRVWPDAPLHSNQGLRYWRKPDGLVRAAASPAHRAGPDAYVTAFHLRDLLDLAPLEDLLKWSKEPALQTICHIGKQRGMRWRQVDMGFLHWVLGDDKDFDEDVKFTAITEIQRRERITPAAEDEDQSRGTE